jgi:type II secretory pathway pseudopilin PulG
MTRVVSTVILIVAALAAPLVAGAQQTAKISRVGVLSQVELKALQLRSQRSGSGLQELGYVEGQNIRIEWQFAEGRRCFRSLKKTRETGDWRSSCQYGSGADPHEAR